MLFRSEQRGKGLSLDSFPSSERPKNAQRWARQHSPRHTDDAYPMMPIEGRDAGAKLRA
jgi:hypothetical protein